MQGKTTTILALTLTLAAAGFSTSACSAHAAPRGAVHVTVRHPAPPTLRADIVVARPGPAYVWVAGHHVWRPAARRYVWVPGKWVQPPRGKTVWVAPRYDRRRGVFVAGYWKR